MTKTAVTPKAHGVSIYIKKKIATKLLQNLEFLHKNVLAHEFWLQLSYCRIGPIIHMLKYFHVPTRVILVLILRKFLCVIDTTESDSGESLLQLNDVIDTTESDSGESLLQLNHVIDTTELDSGESLLLYSSIMSLRMWNLVHWCKCTFSETFSLI